ARERPRIIGGIGCGLENWIGGKYASPCGCSRRHIDDLVSSLLLRGADKDALNVASKTPLMHASRRDVNARMDDGTTPLMYGVVHQERFRACPLGARRFLERGRQRRKYGTAQFVPYQARRRRGGGGPP
ncbi:unnamed protein product, partial [Ectocarpus fasciculatus]